jgi:hypothetical protein
MKYFKDINKIKKIKIEIKDDTVLLCIGKESVKLVQRNYDLHRKRKKQIINKYKKI